MIMRTPPRIPLPEHPLDRIAFAGPMCSGKTTLANVLSKNLGYKKTAFAKKLKDVSEDLYGKITKDNEGRKLLQELSDDLKKWDKNLFMTHLMLDIAGYYNKGLQLIVVDDLRYLEEYRLLKNNGFTIIGVACREDIRLNRIYSLYPDTDSSRLLHPSELGWKQMTMDYWLDTTDGVSALYDIEEIGRNRNAVL